MSVWTPSCCINQAKSTGDANKNQQYLQVSVGIREEICLIDANIGTKFPSHQVKKGEKRYSIEPKALCCVMV